MSNLNDFLYRGFFTNHNIRFAYASTKNLVNKAVLLHNCDPASAHVLGRALTAGVLTAPLLGVGERHSIAWRYNGALRTTIVEVGSRGDVRGMLNNTSLMQEADVRPDIYGTDGTINLVRSDRRRVLRTSTTKAALLDVADDLAFLFSTSDQVESGLVVLIGFKPNPKQPVKLCQGLLLQAMPDCDLQELDALRQRLQSEEFRDLLATEAVADNHFERLLGALTETPANYPYKIHACPPPEYACECNREKTLEVLKTLPRSELLSAHDNGEELAVNCQFCREHYVFQPADYADLLQS